MKSTRSTRENEAFEKDLKPRQSHLEIASRQDLFELKNELLEAIENLKKRSTDIQENPSISKRFYKTGEMMKMLGLSRNSINDLRTSGAIPAVRVHGIYLFENSDVEKFISDNKS